MSLGLGLGLGLHTGRWNDGRVLDLDLVNSGGPAPLGTYTRATGGYTFSSGGVLVANTANQPRPDYDPATLVTRGWLMEGSRTNLLLYSEDFTQANWPKTRVLAFGSGSVSNATAAPDGASTADKVVEDTTASNDHYVQQSYTKAASSIAYSFSIHVKAAERSRILLVAYGSSFANRTLATFNVANGTIASAAAASGSFSAASSQIESCGSGWYRCTINFTTDTHTSVICRAALDDGSSSAYTGDGTSGIYIWGAQLEAATFPSSYIPTTTGSASRSADLWTISNAQFLAATGQNIPQAGTMFVEFAFAGGDSTLSSDSRVVLQIDDGTTDNRHSIRNRSGAVGARSVTATAEVAAFTVTGTANVGTVVKAAYRFKTDDCRLARDGSLSAADAAPSAMGAVDRIAIGSTSTGATPGFVWLRRVIIYSRDLTDTEITRLSA